jgi:hypothetical protein
MICSYCNQPILPDEPKVRELGEWLHIGCAVQQQDGFDLDNSMGD